MTSVAVSGVTCAVLATVLWGTSFLAAKFTLERWEPITASVLRFAIAAVIMALVFPRIGYRLSIPRKWATWRGITLTGMTGFALLYPLQLYGLKTIPSGLSAAIMLTSPLFIVIFGAIFLGDKLSAPKLGGITLGALGALMLLDQRDIVTLNSAELLNPAFIRGVLLTLASCVSWALSVVITRKVVHEVELANLTFWSMAVGLVAMLPFCVYETGRLIPALPVPSGLVSTLALLYLSVVCTVVCYFLWNKALMLASPKDLASTLFLETPVAVIIGVTFASEKISLGLVIGAVLVACGVLLSQRGNTS